jgi:uncharacterized membrane protein
MRSTARAPVPPVGATARDAAAESVAEPPEERSASVRRWRYSLPGLVGALVFVCLSLSPSLLPRTG